jgi:hypothetical protein
MCSESVPESEVEVTPEMEAAGRLVLDAYCHHFSSPETVCREVFLAMAPLSPLAHRAECEC